MEGSSSRLSLSQVPLSSGNLVSNRISRCRENNGAATVNEESVTGQQLGTVALLVLNV